MRFAVLSVMAVALLATTARAEIRGDVFTSPDWQVSITAPRHWQSTERTSYPNILLRMSAQNGKMLLAAERLAKPKTTLAYATETARILKGAGFKVRAPQFHSATAAHWFDMDDGEGAYLRQAFVVDGNRCYVLTLAAPTNRTRNIHLRAFDAALRSLKFVRTKQQPTTQDSEQESAGDKPGEREGTEGE
jgi:hypothetical protein